MRGLKSTLALVVVLIGLGAYIYFVTWNQPDGGSASKQDKVFADLTDTAKIDEVTVKSESGDVTSVKKEGESWRIVSPVTAPASSSEMSALTSALGQAEVVRVIDENAASLDEYGLAAPRLDVEFKAGGQTLGRLLVGEKSPTGAGLYAMKAAEKRVFLIQAYQDSSLNRSTFDLRDKSLIKLPSRDKVQALDLTVGKTTIKLAKKENAWRVTAPIDGRAEFTVSEGVIGRAETAQFKSIETENAGAADLRKYGLDRPEITATITLADSTHTVAFGGKAPDGGVYARDASSPMVVAVESSVVDDFRKTLDNFRTKDVFEFRAYNATHAELTWDDKTLVLDRVKTEGDKPDVWKRVSPNPADLDKGKVDAMLASLAEFRATSFTSAAGTGLDKPALTVTMKFDEGKKEEKATIGRRGDMVYAARPDDHGAATIDAEKFDEVIKALEELLK
jgi:hypothetical protein